MEIPYTVTARPDTGLWNAKVGIWLFLASEVMLFGGLFSSYIFLRLGAPYPWPEDELNVTLGFANTIVLILSSVFVVFAWVSLKMRNYSKYVIWMSLVVLCAAIFMVNKAFEYNAKFHHYSVRLNDKTIVAGHLHDHHDAEFKFKAQEMVVDYQGGSPKCLDGLSNEVKFTDAKTGEEADPLEWFGKFAKATALRDKADNLLASGDSAKAEKLQKKLGETFPDFAAFEGGTTKTFKLEPAGEFHLNRKEVKSWTKTSLGMKGQTTLNGSMESDKIKIELDRIDLRRFLQPDEGGVTLRKPEDSALFKYLPEDAKAEYLHHREDGVKEFEETLAKLKERNSGAVKLPTFREYDDYKMKATGLEAVRKMLGGGKKDEHGDGHAHPTVEIPWEEVNFFSNFGPSQNTYYSIYFTLTGLHGLHVVGGALVLTYFLVFGRKLYRKNPEHLANRVEVGGLFWHFVDLVWIFLFPILYLM